MESRSTMIKCEVDGCDALFEANPSGTRTYCKAHTCVKCNHIISWDHAEIWNLCERCKCKFVCCKKEKAEGVQLCCEKHTCSTEGCEAPVHSASMWEKCLHSTTCEEHFTDADRESFALFKYEPTCLPP